MNTLLSSETRTPVLARLSAPPPPVALRVLRVALLLGLSLLLSLLLGLALFSALPVGDSFTSAVSWTGHSEIQRAALLCLGIVVLVTTTVLLAAWRLRLRSWWWIVGGYLALAPVLAYLATDDASYRFPVTIEELSPSFPGADKSFAVFMRYGKNQPLAKDFKVAPPIFGGKRPKETAEWLHIVRENRATIEQQWTALAPAWSWWNELNSFDRIGDLTAASFEAEVIAFAPCRAISQYACAQATLLALDGQGDAALDLVLPLLQVSRKLQPSSRTLVRLMIALVIERLAMETAHVVLDHATVSPAKRAQLAALLQPGNIEAAARRLVMVDYIVTIGAFTETNWKIGDILVVNSRAANYLGRPLNLLSPFVYNPHATFNLYGDYIRDLAELLARREMSKFEARERQFFEIEAQPRFKNFMGAIVAHQIVPAFKKVTAAFWETQDMRAALLQRATSP